MKTLTADLERRLLFILHYGMCQARNLAQSGQTQQVFELMDALEIVPTFMNQWEDRHLNSIREILRDYQRKYPGGAFDYLAHLDEYDVPERF